jgi:hypothetical protein
VGVCLWCLGGGGDTSRYISVCGLDGMRESGGAGGADGGSSSSINRSSSRQQRATEGTDQTLSPSSFFMPPPHQTTNTHTHTSISLSLNAHNTTQHTHRHTHNDKDKPAALSDRPPSCCTPSAAPALAPAAASPCRVCVCVCVRECCYWCGSLHWVLYDGQCIASKRTPTPSLCFPCCGVYIIKRSEGGSEVFWWGICFLA